MIEQRDMEVPAPFKNACRNLCQDLDLFVSTPEEMIQWAMHSVDRKDVPEITAFLDFLLQEHFEGERLKEIWWSMPSDIVFHDADSLVRFLKLWRSTLA